MTTAQTPAPPQQPTPTRKRWRAPRSFGGTLTLFVVAYLLWQPLATAVLPRLVGMPRLEGRAAWQLFLLVLPVLGVIAGATWWLGASRPRGPLRYWLRGTARMLALTTMLMAAQVGVQPIAIWCAVVLGSAAVMGALFGWIERWESPPEHRTPPA